MAYFSDLPIDNNATIDVYALLRTQFLSAIKAKREIESRLKGMTDPGEIRFYKKRVKYTPKGASKPRVYEYNCHYIRTEEKVLDKKNREKTRHSTRFLKNDKYEEKKQASALYHFLKGQLEDVIKMINRVKKMILSGFYHHPDDIPDLIEEEELVYKEMSRSDDSREDHLSQRYAWASDKYKCINKNAEAFMSRGELLLHDAFLECGLTPQYETRLELSQTDKDPESGLSYTYEKVFYPDFKCTCAGKTYYIEYFGKMNDPAYFKDACEKLRFYAKNGIIQGYNLIAFCSGDSSAIQIEPAIRALRQIAAGRSLLTKSNINELPGIIHLDTADSWSFSTKFKQFIANSAKKYLPKRHKYKSSEKRKR